MTLALVFAAMTVAVVVPLLLPLLRGGSKGESADPELAIYRDQLTELKLDTERGLLTGEEAGAAEIEIKRRMLAAANRAKGSESEAPKPGWPRERIAMAVIAGLIPLGAAALYLAVGSPGEPDQPFATRGPAAAAATAAAGHSDQDMAAAVARLADRLARQPDDLGGWVLLARSYLAAGTYDKAVDAYRHAFALDRNDPEISGGFAEALVNAAGGTVTPEALLLFQQLSQERPDEARTRYYLGLAAAQAGEGRRALEIWVGLEADSPEGMPWQGALRERIAAAAKEFGIDPKTVEPEHIAPRTPVASTAASAGSAATAAQGGAQATEAAPAGLSNEQMTMVQAMVARLAARLESNPNDLEGWGRLGRSYRVLGESARSRDALAKAVALDPGNAALVGEYADAILAAPDGNAPLPDKSVDTMRKKLASESSDPQALWYVGLAEARAKKADEAKAMWTKLLGLLPPDDAGHATVKAALDDLSATP
ncbi:MAG: c-type cytochrome biogenesis protein CcmI [Alphaproteobacteria bacterium]